MHGWRKTCTGAAPHLGREDARAQTNLYTWLYRKPSALDRLMFTAESLSLVA